MPIPRPGDEVLFSRHAFLVYEIVTRANSATPVMVPDTNTIKVDVEAMLAAVTPKTRMVYIANPNNPTGSYSPTARRWRGCMPGCSQDVLLVIDAAYAEYVTAKDYEAGIELAHEPCQCGDDPHLLQALRLGGLRMGWVYAPAAICDVLNRIRGPFNVTTAAAGGGAAAVARPRPFSKAVAHNSQWLPWITGRNPQDSATGVARRRQRGQFRADPFSRGRAECAEAADRLPDGMRAVSCVACASYGLPNCLRMTVGTEEQNAGWSTALRKCHGGVRWGHSKKIAIIGLGLIGSSIAHAAGGECRRRDCRL